ncbi:MAG: hypothetical protein OHK0029_41000 [Armatimonadaceae bacterium]
MLGNRFTHWELWGRQWYINYATAFMTLTWLKVWRGGLIATSDILLPPLGIATVVLILQYVLTKYKTRDKNTII